MKLDKIFKNIFDWASLRLSLFFVLIVMMISVGFSVALFNISSNEIDQGLGRQARVLRDTQLNAPTPGLDFEQIRQQQLDESSNSMRSDLIYYNLIILLLSSVASYFFARKMLEPIREAVEAQNRFTADASHELRTPLTALRTEIEVSLRNKDLNLDESRKLLNSNLEEIEKLETLSNALLKLAKNENAKPDFGEVNLEEIVTEAYEKIEKLAQKKIINFENSLRPVMVSGDKHSLVELFVILLDNAIKYSPKNSIVAITIEQLNNRAIVRVTDHGIGIKASELPYIFNRFYRADSARSKENISGYGLGLAIAKQIVELHSGAISVASSPGHGSEFTVKLPV